MVDGNMIHNTLNRVPGVGKDTLVDLSKTRSEYLDIYTGDLCPSKISANPKIGLMAKSIIGGGEWVPDERVMEQLNNRLVKGNHGKVVSQVMKVSIPIKNLCNDILGVLN